MAITTCLIRVLLETYRQKEVYAAFDEPLHYSKIITIDIKFYRRYRVLSFLHLSLLI